MNPNIFDAVTKNLSDNWEFERLCQYIMESSVAHGRELDCCLLLADMGKLDKLHNFIGSEGLYNLIAKADTCITEAPKKQKLLALFEIYKNELEPFFSEGILPEGLIDSQLLSKSQLKDSSIYKDYLTNNADQILQKNHGPTTLMYLMYTVIRHLESTSDVDTLRLIINRFDQLNNLTAVSRAYLTSNLVHKGIFHKDAMCLPQAGYSELHKLLAALVMQSNGQPGPERLYQLLGDSIRPDLRLCSSGSSISLGRPSRPQRVAVCISGMYRCNDQALRLIQDNVINPLNADVFVHTWEEMQLWPGLGGSGDDWLLRVFSRALYESCPQKLKSKRFFKNRFPQTFSVLNSPTSKPFTLQSIPTDLNLKGYSIDNPELFLERYNVPTSGFLSGGILNQAKMFYGIYQAHELAKAYELKYGFEYDFIVRCRPDIGILTKLSSFDLDALRNDQLAVEFTRNYGPQDQFWYGRRIPALKMAALWEASISCGSLSPFESHPRLYAHNLILGWMTYSKIQPKGTIIRRDMNAAISSAVPPDFSAALSNDFSDSAKEFAASPEYLNFFRMLQDHNREK